MTDDYENHFYEILYDIEGNERRVLRNSIEPESKEDSTGWTVYDSSHGHCYHCGRLCCNGRCIGGG
jgi:hypothetical protein